MRRVVALIRLALFATAASAIVAFAAEADPRAGGAAVLQPGPFTLERVDGGKLDGIDLDGAPYGLMFGFTSCPDICPTALAELTTALQSAPKLPQDFKVYFIATDVERDSPRQVKALLGAFDPRIVGLTGTQAEIDGATRAFGAVARRVDFPGGAHTVEHTAALFLIDANGVIADRVSFKAPAAEMAKRIEAVAGG